MKSHRSINYVLAPALAFSALLVDLNVSCWARPVTRRQAAGVAAATSEGDTASERQEDRKDRREDATQTQKAVTYNVAKSRNDKKDALKAQGAARASGNHR